MATDIETIYSLRFREGLDLLSQQKTSRVSDFVTTEDGTTPPSYVWIVVEDDGEGLIAGETEFGRNTVQVKNLSTKTAVDHPAAGVVDQLVVRVVTHIVGAPVR